MPFCALSIAKGMVISMKKTIFIALFCLLTIGLSACGNAATTESKTGSPVSGGVGNSITSDKDAQVGSSENGSKTDASKGADEQFEKALKKAEEAEDKRERDALLLTQLDIKNERMSSTAFLFTITNNTNYVMEAVRFNYSPVIGGVAMLEGRDELDYDAIDSEWMLHNYNYLLRGFDAGETVHLKVEFGRSSRSTSKDDIVELIETDVPKLMSFNVKAIHMATDVYKNLEMTNFKYDDQNGPSYTLENKSERTLYPTVEVIYYKDGKPINMASYNKSVEIGEKVDVVPHYLSSANENLFKPFEVAHDEIKTFLTRK